MVQVRRARRGSRLAGAAGALGALALVAASGCSLHQAGVSPPDNRIFFPSGGVVDPDGSFLYVANSNSDLRYNAGTIVAIDLPRVGAAAAMDWSECPSDPRFVPPANTPPFCCHDHLDPTILNCDEQALVDREWSVRVGSFAGTPVIQRFLVPNTDTGSGAPALVEPSDSNRRLFVPVRGDTSITMMNLGRGLSVGEPKLYCTGPRRNPNATAAEGPAPTPPKFAACDDEWRITRKDDPLETPAFSSIPDSDVVRLPEEPYALAIDDAANLLYAGHLRGSVSLIDLGIQSGIPAGSPPQVPRLLDLNNNVLPGDANGSVGVTSLTIRDATNPNCSKEIFASSRYRPVASSFVIYGLNGARCDATATGSENERN